MVSWLAPFLPAPSQCRNISGIRRFASAYSDGLALDSHQTSHAHAAYDIHYIGESGDFL